MAQTCGAVDARRSHDSDLGSPLAVLPGGPEMYPDDFGDDEFDDDLDSEQESGSDAQSGDDDEDKT